MSNTVNDKIQPQWWGKTLVGLVLGVTLTYGLMGLIIWFGPDSINNELSGERLLWKTQFNMWMVTPIWMSIVSLVYLFKTTKTALIYLGGANVVVYALFLGLRGLL